MVDSQIHRELVKQLEHLPPSLQQQVLDFARSLSSSQLKPRGIPSQELLKFAGVVGPEDCRAMMEAIEAGCEQVDANEW